MKGTRSSLPAYGLKRSYKRMLLASLTTVFVTAPCYAASPASLLTAQHKAAVEQARAGDARGALTVLRNLLQQNPQNSSLLADTAIVASWAGEDSYALSLYDRPTAPHDNYDVVIAAAHSARNLHLYDQALGLYHHAALLCPDRWQALLGEAMVLTDTGQYAQADGLMKPILHDHPSDLAVETGEAYLCQRKADFACVLRMDQQRSAQLSRVPAAVQDQMSTALARLGANSLAAESYRGSNAQQSLQLKAALGAERIRWAEADRTWPEQKKDAGEAVKLLNEVIAGTSPSEALWGQAQSDRLLAMADLNQPAEVVRLFEALQHSQVKVPDYALLRVADAYLSVRNPRRAESLYRSLTRRMPHNEDLWSGLAWSQFEREHIHESFSTIDRARKDAPALLKARDLRVPQSNQANTYLGLQAAEMRGFAGLSGREQKILRSELATAPANPGLNHALAMTYLARGWPDRAARQERVADSFEQPTALPVLQDVQILDQAGLRDRADALLRPLRVRDGNYAPMMRYLRNRAVERGWQADVHGGMERSSGRYIGKNQFSDAHLYSPLLDNRWRFYLHGSGDHGTFREGETWRSRGALGLSFDYDRKHLWAEAAADQNPVGARLGIAAGSDLALGDHWTIGLQGDTDDLSQIQLISSIADIHARSGGGSLQWRQSDLAMVSTGFERILFSDGNQRTIFSGTWDQRAINAPHFQINLSPQVWTSWNSRDENRVYYNPKHDLSAGASATLQWITWRRYERNVTQKLTVFGAPYWQQDHGTGTAMNASYIQNWALSPRFGAFGKMTWNSQPYDGSNEPYTDIIFGLTWGPQ